MILMVSGERPRTYVRIGTGHAAHSAWPGRRRLQSPYKRLCPHLPAPWGRLSGVTDDRSTQPPDPPNRRFDRMNTSKLLGATMVAGALAAGGAISGIAGAAAAPRSTSTAATTTQSPTPPTP